MWQFKPEDNNSLVCSIGSVCVCVCVRTGGGTLERLRRIWMEKVMTSMQGTLLLQLQMSAKMMLVAPLSTSRSQHTGDSLVAVSAGHNTQNRISEPLKPLRSPGAQKGLAANTNDVSSLDSN